MDIREMKEELLKYKVIHTDILIENVTKYNVLGDDLVELVYTYMYDNIVDIKVTEDNISKVISFSKGIYTFEVSLSNGELYVLKNSTRQNTVVLSEGQKEIFELIAEVALSYVNKQKAHDRVTKIENAIAILK